MAAPTYAEIIAFDGGGMSPKQEADFVARAQSAPGLFIPKRFARARAAFDGVKQAAADVGKPPEQLQAERAQTSMQKRQALADVAREASNEIDRYNESENPMTKAAAFGMGAADTMALGYADEARGLLELANPMTHVRTAQALARGEQPRNLLDVMGEARDDQRDASKQLQELAPGYYGTGGLAGSAVGMVGGGGATGVKTFGQAVKGGAKVGAGTGAAVGFGQGEGAEDSLLDGAMGAVLGAMFGGAAGGAGSLLTKTGRASVGEGVDAAVAGAKSASAKVQPMIGAFVDKAEEMGPAARFGLGVLTMGKFNAAYEAAKVLRKFAPEVADKTPVSALANLDLPVFNPATSSSTGAPRAVATASPVPQVTQVNRAPVAPVETQPNYVFEGAPSRATGSVTMPLPVARVPTPVTRVDDSLVAASNAKTRLNEETRRNVANAKTRLKAATPRPVTMATPKAPRPVTMAATPEDEARAAMKARVAEQDRLYAENMAIEREAQMFEGGTAGRGGTRSDLDKLPAAGILDRAAVKAKIAGIKAGEDINKTNPGRKRLGTPVAKDAPAPPATKAEVKKNVEAKKALKKPSEATFEDHVKDLRGMAGFKREAFLAGLQKLHGKKYVNEVSTEAKKRPRR
jgi:hypothetical protein